MGKKYRRLRRAVVALALFASLGAADASAQFLTFDQCQEVESDQRETYQQAALHVAQLGMKQDVAEIHRQLSPITRRTVSVEQLSAAFLAPLAQLTQGLGEPHVTHSFLVTSRGSASDHTVMCGAHKAPADLGDKVFVSVTSVPKQAHVIVEANSDKYIVTFAVWLVPGDSGDWFIHGLDVLWTTLIGKTAADLRATAQDQHRRGHAFTAAILYSGASVLAYRGKYLQPSLWQDIQKEAKALELPKELTGDPPFTWQIDADTFRILAVGPTGMGRKLVLTVQREVPSLADTTSVDGESRRFISGFIKSHPDVREVFDAIVVQAMEAGSGRAFDTAEDLKK